MEKTGNKVVIPIRAELQAILDKYDNRLPKAYEQKVNKYIKEIDKVTANKTKEIMEI